MVTTAGKKNTAMAGPSHCRVSSVASPAAAVSPSVYRDQCQPRGPPLIAIVLSQQQRLDAVRMHHVLARRPGEHREVSVLRGDERDRVALIVDELRGGEVPRAAEQRRMHDARHESLDRLGD